MIQIDVVLFAPTRYDPGLINIESPDGSGEYGEASISAASGGHRITFEATVVLYAPAYPSFSFSSLTFNFYGAVVSHPQLLLPNGSFTVAKSDCHF